MPVTRRDRWLALALLLAALGLAYLLFVHPWWTQPMLDVDARIEAARERDLRIRTQLMQAPEIDEYLAKAGMEAARHPGFLREPTAELATAGLVKRLETVVAEASPGNRSCAISNRSPLQVPGQQRFQQVTVQVRLQCGVSELAAVLHTLESGAPRLFIDNLNISPQRYGHLPGSAGDNRGGLDVSFSLYGFLPPAAPASPATQSAPRAGTEKSG